MEVLRTVSEIQGFLRDHCSQTIGFVPTMGALHQGHLSLIEASKKENDLTICSIFVNPKQFNKEEDLVKYPRNIEEDIKQLKNVHCDVVFIPSVEEMYPEEINKTYEFGILSEVMEGEHRPGHFDGVAMVIQRFLEIIEPTSAYFGEKDFQQLAVVRALVRQLNFPVNIVGCPIYREKSGLAMSSRNERLSKYGKEAASEISKALTYVSHHKKKHTVSELKACFLDSMAKNKLLKTEYFEIADTSTLKPIQDWDEAENYIAFTAVNVEGVRLIDNMTIIN